LAVGEGIYPSDDVRSPFTEESLMKLYKKPATGEARYTWVHWARRLAASNNVAHHASHPSYSHAHYLNLAENPTHSTSSSDTITTIQFLYSPSKLRILFALTLMLTLSVLAALLWIFLGAAGTGWRLDLSRQRSDRVGSGMAAGVLVLLVESVGFAAWVAFS
jgi:hypothetical protein